MDARGMVRRRMRGLGLWGPSARPQDVVHALTAMQAQEFIPALWSVAQRSRTADRGTMERLYDEGAILRTHVLRPTWHFVTPEDIRWVLAATAHRVQARNAAWYRQMGLDARLLARGAAVVAGELEGGHRTRAELQEALAGKRIAASGPRLAGILMHAELEGVISSGTLRGKQRTYALLDERAPGGWPSSREDAIADLTRRYYATRGPATLKDFVWWSSLTVGEARGGIEAADLEPVEAGGRTYWSAPDASASRAPRSPRIDLVQIYDEVGMSYTESRDILLASETDRRVPGGAPLPHSILLDGRLIGHWRAVEGRGSVTLEISTYRPLTPTERGGLDDAIVRYERFASVPVALG